MTAPLKSALRDAFGDQWFDDAERCRQYARDYSAHQGHALAVVLPAATAQVQALVEICRAYRTPLVARGLGSSNTGSAVPIEPSIVVCFEAMRRIARIETADRFAVVEPGVTNRTLQDELGNHGFFWGPDPGSADFCTIGGNLACNAAGPRAVKYGSCRENTLGLQVVTGTGALIECGGKTSKISSGYDLTRLLIGSEGTLGIITEATLRIIPKPPVSLTLRAAYKSIDAATAAIAQIMAQAETPAALEFLDHQALCALTAQSGMRFEEAARALLLIRVDGHAEQIDRQLEQIERAAQVPGLITLVKENGVQRATDLWSARKEISGALRRIAPQKISEDVVVPVSRLPALQRSLQEIATTCGIPVVSYGHAGNGNLHVNFLYEPDRPEHAARIAEALSRMFDRVLALEGALSGEHGIGLEKAPFLPRAFNAGTLEAMRAIKRVFDPDGILNPGKIFPN